jgi:outer membrane receptor protein involved in Fe transport
MNKCKFDVPRPFDFRRFSVLKLVIILFVGFCVCAERQAVAQSTTNSANQPTEILVAGTLRHLAPINVPSSVSILDAEELKNSATTIVDVVGSVAGLSFAGGSTTPRFFQIRGIGEFEQYESVPNPSVALYVDNIDFSGLGMPIPLFGVESFEVFKGPQMTAFGSNALAGVINVTTDEPSRRVSGRVALDKGSDDLMLSGATISSGGDLFAGLKAIITRVENYQSGYRSNTTLNADDTNRINQESTRLKIIYDADPDTVAKFAVIDFANRNGYDAFTIDNSFTVESDRPGQDSLVGTGASVEISVGLTEDVELEILGNVLSSQQRYSYDGDWGSDEFWGSYAPYDYFSATKRERNSFGSSIRIQDRVTPGQSARYSYGVSFNSLEEETSIVDDSSRVPYREFEGDYDSDAVAVFGEQELALNDKWVFVIGARLERRNINFVDDTGLKEAPSDSMVGGSSSLRYSFSEELVGYYTLSRGFKGGGVNSGTSIPENLRLYDPESVVSSELGVKGSSLNGDLRFGSSLFFVQRLDAQLKFAYQNNPLDPLSFTYLTRSVAEGNSLGLELNYEYVGFKNFVLFGMGSFIDSKYTSVPEENINLLDRDFSAVSPWQYSFGARAYLSDFLFLESIVSGRSGFFYDDSHDEKSSAYYILNSSLVFEQDRIRLRLWGRNLLDRRYGVRGFYFGIEPPDYTPKEYLQLGDPRTIGLSIEMNF